MSDTLKIYGVTYTGVTSLNAKDLNHANMKYVRAVDGNNMAYGMFIPAVVDQAVVGISVIGDQTQPIVGTALAGLTEIGG